MTRQCFSSLLHFALIKVLHSDGDGIAGKCRTQPLLRTHGVWRETPSIRLVRTMVHARPFVLNCIIIIQIDMPGHNSALWFNAHRHTGRHLQQPLNVSQWKTDCLCISHLCICAWSATPQPFVNTSNLLHFRCSFINKFEYIFQLQLAWLIRCIDAVTPLPLPPLPACLLAQLTHTQCVPSMNFHLRGLYCHIE